LQAASPPKEMPPYVAMTTMYGTHVSASGSSVAPDVYKHAFFLCVHSSVHVARHAMNASGTKARKQPNPNNPRNTENALEITGNSGQSAVYPALKGHHRLRHHTHH